MNILDAEDMIKGLPDQALMQQAQMPTGELPQFLVVSEIQRRSDMRKRHEAQMQEQSQGTVKDQIMREGIAAMMPQQPMGMPPQMMPQGMPPQVMPPQGMPTGMPPMGMAAGGIVRMQRGGFLDQYVAGAEAGPMPGGSTIRDQLDRVLNSGMSYPEILSFVSKTFYGRPEVLEYVQSKVGRPEPTMGSGGMGERSPSIDIDASQPKLEYAFPQEGPQAIRESAQIDLAPQGGSASLFGTGFGGADYPSTKPGTESADPLSGMLELAQEAYTDASDPRRQLSPSIDTDALISGMVSERAPRSGGIPDLSTAPQRGAGGRPFDVGVFGDLFEGIGFDLGMPTREQGMAADRARVERIRQKAAGTYDDPNTPEKRRARLEQLAQLGAEGPDETVQEINERLGIGPTGPVTSPFGVDGKKAGGKDVQGGSEVQAQSLSEIVVDRDRKDLSGILSRMIGDGTDKSSPPALDLSDIIAQSEKMAKANALMQLGAGIAEGSVAKGISAAGIAATKGMQDARSLEMKKRLAEYQAGREDLAREEKASQFERTFGLSERELAGKMEISKDVTAREGLRGLLALYETAFGEEKEQLKARIMPLINRLLGEEQPADFGGMQTGQQDYSGFRIRR